MDNQYQQYAPSKPTPPSPLGDESKGWIPTGGHWWFGPMDGENEDTHGKDGGISAKTISGRTSVTVGSTKYFTYDTLLDGCVYEYARPGSLPDSSATVTASDLLSDWSCPCYDGSGNLMGNYTIHSDCDWVKFVVVSVGYSINDIIPPFAVRYFIAENTGNVRKGSVTVTTPGGVSHYDANHTRSYSGDGEIDYKYMSPRESRKRSGRNSSSHYDDYNHYRDESDAELSGKDNKNKTSDDLFEKHSRKFRR